MLRGQGRHGGCAAALGHANRIAIAVSPLFIISLRATVVTACFVVSTQVNSFILLNPTPDPINLTFLSHGHHSSPPPQAAPLCLMSVGYHLELSSA